MSLKGRFSYVYILLHRKCVKTLSQMCFLPHFFLRHMVDFSTPFFSLSGEYMYINIYACKVGWLLHSLYTAGCKQRLPLTHFTYFCLFSQQFYFSLEYSLPLYDFNALHMVSKFILRQQMYFPPHFIILQSQVQYLFYLYISPIHNFDRSENQKQICNVLWFILLWSLCH